MEKEHIRFYIFTRFKFGINANDIHRELCAVWGEFCASYFTITNWIYEFNQDRQSIEDAARPGRPEKTFDIKWFNIGNVSFEFQWRKIFMSCKNLSNTLNIEKHDMYIEKREWLYLDIS